MIIETRNIRGDDKFYKVTLTETAREELTAESLAGELVTGILDGYETDSEVPQAIVQALKENDLI